MEVISEFYNLNLRNEVFKGMKENARRGFHNGGTAPYGYRLNKVTESSGASKSILVPGPDDEVATVKRIFHNYVYDNYGYKKIASDLNIEGIPSSSGNQWSYSSIHSILHNEAYTGNTIWNMHAYNTGKKKKPEEEWIKQENTHMALVSREVFDLVKEKSKSRIKNSNLFEATNTTFILRGLFKCPYCGSNMIGSQSGNKKGTKTIRKYYLCGNYQRKGKSSCKFKSFNKERLEAAIINSLLKEFTFLAMDKVLDEEIIRYTSSLNKELTFKLNNITQQTELINMRIELSKKELSFSSNKEKLEDYINELNIELKNLLIAKCEAESILNSSNISSEEISLTRDRIKDFLVRIYSSTPDVQNMLLKQFIKSINYNLINDTISVHIIIKSNSDENVLLDKNLYASF